MVSNTTFNIPNEKTNIWALYGLTHWGRVTHICVSELTIIASDNGLSPGRRQAIIWNNAGLLLIEPLGKNFSEISIGIQTFSFKKMHLIMSSAKWRPFCLGLNVLTFLLGTVIAMYWDICWARPRGGYRYVLDKQNNAVRYPGAVLSFALGVSNHDQANLRLNGLPGHHSYPILY